MQFECHYSVNFIVMERWAGRVALVTGASAGIGCAIARALVCQGMRVVGCARNTQKIQELAQSLDKEKGSLFPVTCDVSKEDQILSMFEQTTDFFDATRLKPFVGDKMNVAEMMISAFDKIKSSYGGVDVCINNAGLSHDAPLLSGKTELWRNMLEVNILGLSICTREAVKSMKERNIDDGHVININSVVGHRQYANNPSGHFYSATKFAVNALTEGLKNELTGTHIRVTSISPGLTETEFAYRMFEDNKARAEQTYSRIENLKPEDIAEGVVYALSVPNRVRVSELTIRTTET